MSQAVIPFQNYDAFSESVALDNGVFGLTFHWNTRGQFWSMDIADANGLPLVSGVRLVIMYPLLYQHKKDGMPAGDMLVYDKNPITNSIEPGRNDFVNGRCSLLYWSDL